MGGIILITFNMNWVLSQIETLGFMNWQGGSALIDMALPIKAATPR